MVVLVLGTDQTVERESHDRTTITLPGVQAQLAQQVRCYGNSALCSHAHMRTHLQVLALGKPTLAVLLNGGVLAVPNLKASASAILEAWFPGVHGAQAIADVIFGAYNPGGKLPFTMYDEAFVTQVALRHCSRVAPSPR